MAEATRRPRKGKTSKRTNKAQPIKSAVRRVKGAEVSARRKGDEREGGKSDAEGLAGIAKNSAEDAGEVGVHEIEIPNGRTEEGAVVGEDIEELPGVGNIIGTETQREGYCGGIAAAPYRKVETVED